MAYLAFNKNGTEQISVNKPTRDTICWYDWHCEGFEQFDISIELPEGSIKKLIGRELTWEDEPVEI